MNRATWATVLAGMMILLLGGPGIVVAAELKIFSTRAIATVLDKVGPEFEHTTGHRLNVTTDIAIRMVRRIRDGEPFDFLVAAPGQMDALIKEGKIIPETRTDLTRSGIGVQVRAGAPKPDISSVDAFKRALLNAKSIAYLKEGQKRCLPRQHAGAAWHRRSHQVEGHPSGNRYRLRASRQR
jgi:molybdate transport system substrate-binding protein